MAENDDIPKARRNIREELDKVTNHDHFRYAEDFEEWIKDNPPEPISEERKALNLRRLAAIERMAARSKPPGA